MRINQNISALNAYRNMVNTENRLNKSLERLSSGLRINRAADDAAGLAISEKMRGQIQGLNQAMRNAQDGISLIQTAEGALNETHSILQRMRELSVQAANDTLTASDRMEIQKEIDQLTSEIDRIANTTEFNTKKLLDGTTSALTSTSDLKTQVFMRDGLRTIDQFGQKAVEGGNFKLDIEATPGAGQVQKTDIMKIKHEGGSTAISSTLDSVADQTTGTGATIGDAFLTGAATAAFEYSLTYTEDLIAGDAVVIGAVEDGASNSGDAVVTHNNTYTGSSDGDFILEATAVNSAEEAVITGGAYTLNTDVSGATNANVIITVDGTTYTANLSSWDGSTAGTASESDLIDLLHDAVDSSSNQLSSVATITGDGSALTITHDTAGENTISVAYDGDDASVVDSLANLTGITADSTNTGANANVEWTKTGPDGTSVTNITLEDGESTTAVDGFEFTVDYSGGLAAVSDTFTVSVTAATASDGWVLDGTADLDGNYALDDTIEYLGVTADLSEITGASNDDVITVNTHNEQAISFSNVSGGTFTLTYNGEETADLNYDISVADLQTALEELTGLTESNVEVGGSTGAWTVTFMDNLAGTNVDELIIDDSNLEGMGDIGDLANTGTALYDIDRFWDASGNFLVDDPQTITLVQGDGSKASFTIFGTDTIQDVQDKLNNAIHEGLDQQQFNDNAEAYAKYVDSAVADSEFYSVEGTFVIQSAVTGSDGQITFVGDESIINALSLTTIQESSETLYDVTVTNAHSGEEVTQERISGNMLIGAVHENVDVRFDAMAGIDLDLQTDGAFEWDSSSEAYETFVHLADNSMVFQIGANPLQDVDAAIGDMRASALGVDNILVTNRDAANRAISQLDSAIERVSGERSKLGAVQNRLDHTINNLGVAAENLTAAESRVRDLDFAQEMIEFTRNQIMQQAGTSMLAQANMKPQSVLMLLG